MKSNARLHRSVYSTLEVAINSISYAVYVMTKTQCFGQNTWNHPYKRWQICLQAPQLQQLNNSIKDQPEA